jgi:hypothetical protein
VIPVGGEASKKAAVITSAVSSSVNALAVGEQIARMSCRDESPHLRDLTVSDASQSTPPSSTLGGLR